MKGYLQAAPRAPQMARGRQPLTWHKAGRRRERGSWKAGRGGGVRKPREFPRPEALPPPPQRPGHLPDSYPSARQPCPHLGARPTNCFRSSKMFSSKNFSSRRLRCAASPGSSPARGAAPAPPGPRRAPRTSSSWRWRRYSSSASPASVASCRSRVRCRSESASPFSRQRPSGSAARSSPRAGAGGSSSLAAPAGLGFMAPSPAASTRHLGRDVRAEERGAQNCGRGLMPPGRWDTAAGGWGAQPASFRGPRATAVPAPAAPSAAPRVVRRGPAADNALPGATSRAAAGRPPAWRPPPRAGPSAPRRAPPGVPLVCQGRRALSAGLLPPRPAPPPRRPALSPPPLLPRVPAPPSRADCTHFLLAPYWLLPAYRAGGERPEPSLRLPPASQPGARRDAAAGLPRELPGAPPPSCCVYTISALAPRAPSSPPGPRQVPFTRQARRRVASGTPSRGWLCAPLRQGKPRRAQAMFSRCWARRPLAASVFLWTALRIGGASLLLQALGSCARSGWGVSFLLLFRLRPAQESSDSETRLTSLCLCFLDG